MDSMKSSREVMALFLRVVNKYHALEKLPQQHGARGSLHHSERHMLDTIALRPELNITEHAAALGVTKGAISQVVKKLESKGFLRRIKKVSNDKAVYLELSQQGKEVVEKRKRINEETLRPLAQELRKHSENQVEFLISMFEWIERHLAESRQRMEDRTP
jgi:DNA-binding MarR family transcriptional regulator